MQKELLQRKLIWLNKSKLLKIIALTYMWVKSQTEKSNTNSNTNLERFQHSYPFLSVLVHTPH